MSTSEINYYRSPAYDSYHTCRKCVEWRAHLSLLAPNLPLLPSFWPPSAYSCLYDNIYSKDNCQSSVMVIQSRSIFRRSLPPESVLERAKVTTFSTGADDAPKFNEIVVVTTRRGDTIHTSSTPAPSALSSSSLSNAYYSTFNKYDFPRHHDLTPTLRQMETDEAALRAIRARVARYRQEVDDHTSRVARRRKSASCHTALDAIAEINNKSCATHPSGASSYRRLARVTSYDDDYLTTPVVRSRNTGFCPGHPTASAALPSTHVTRSQFVLPTTSTLPLTPTSQWHYCPASKRIELQHRHQHAELLPLRRSADLYLPRRSYSEVRNSDHLEAADISLQKLRADLRDTTNKFSRHRQMIDRYLRVDPHQRLENVEPAVIKKYDEVAERIPELLIMNYGLYRRPVDSASLWSTSIASPTRYVASTRYNRTRNTTPFEARGRIRSVISRTAQSVPPI